MKTYTSSFNQSTFDICLCIYGSLDYLVKLCFDNNIAINEMVPKGTKINYDSAFTPVPTIYATGTAY